MGARGIQGEATRIRSIGTVIVAIAFVLGTLAVGAGSSSAVAQSAGPTVQCADGAGGGPVYVTDSGLRVADNDSAADRAYPAFPDAETVVLDSEGYDAVSVSAAGQSTLRLEERNESLTCLASVNATEHDVTIAPRGAPNVTLTGSFEGFAFADVDFDAADEADLASEANESVSVIVHDTGLSRGETVAIESLHSDAVDVEVTADGAGNLSIELPTGEHELTLTTPDSGDGGGGLPPPPPDDGEPASFEVSDLALDDERVEVGETVTVTATVTNVGDEPGSHNLVLGVDGTVVEEASVTLDGGESKTVSLSTTLDAAGKVELTVDGETVGTVAVTDPGESDDGAGSSDSADGEHGDDSGESGESDDGDDSSDPGDGRNEGDGMPGFGAVLVLFALTVATVGLVRR
ncbi:CARDB domain-containing protein [Halovivax limisalsi]|uniref:CARDB domain-containing protein n=1 Tax=Halovivax limisalsi TaxID=1453760 RepID=UPI001FFD1503|nr:CARDB domain-containing protein [Halovivax limisalsi]